MAELLVTGIEGLEFFTDEFIKYASVYQRLTQLSDLRPVVSGVAKDALQRLSGRWWDGEMCEQQEESKNIHLIIKDKKKNCSKTWHKNWPKPVINLKRTAGVRQNLLMEEKEKNDNSDNKKGEK